MCIIWIRAPSSVDSRNKQNLVWKYCFCFPDQCPYPAETPRYSALLLSFTPPLLKGAHYLAYFHSRQQRKMFIMLSCVIHREQLCMRKHILSRMPIFSLKKCRRFNCISAVSLLSEWTKDGCSGTSPRAIFMNTFWWRLTNLCYRVAFF